MDAMSTTGFEPVGTVAAPSAVTVLPYKHEDPLFWISTYVAVSIWLALLVFTLGMVVPIVLLMALLGLFTRSLLITWVRGNALRVSPEQFPDLHQHFQYSCQRLGVQRVPELYLCQADGMLNALAVRFMRQDYVVLLSNIVDALKDRPEAIKFYMGHELAHIQRKHLTRHWWLAPAGLMPLLAPAYSRAREYTCDRHGLACCSQLEDAQRALVVLAAGTERWKQVNIGAFEAQARETGGFWMAVNELTADYPWLSKRLVRLKDRDATFPRRSWWAWAIAAVSPRLGYGGAVVGFLYLLMLGLVILALVLALAFNGSAIGERIEQIWQGSIGQPVANEDAVPADEEDASPAAETEAAVEAVSADELHTIGQAVTTGIDAHVVGHSGQFPEDLDAIEGLVGSLGEQVGDRWQGVSFEYLTPEDSGSKSAQVKVEAQCTDCDDQLLNLQYRRLGAGQWSCQASGGGQAVRIEGCPAAN